MGVSASLKAINEADATRIASQPDLLVPFLFGVPAQSAPPRNRSLLKRIFSRQRGTPDQANFSDTPMVTLAGHWEVMTFALSGPNPPADNPLDLVEREFEIFVDVDLGYGPPRKVPTEALSAFQRSLSNLSNEQISARLNREDLAEAEIYEAPEILANLGEWRAALVNKANELRTFAKHCVDENLSALVFFH